MVVFSAAGRDSRMMQKVRAIMQGQFPCYGELEKARPVVMAEFHRGALTRSSR